MTASLAIIGQLFFRAICLCGYFVAFLPTFACAQFPVPATTPYGGPATTFGCYDGDTCTITIPSSPPLFGDRLPIRLAGIDTPERKGECSRERALAIRARAFIVDHLLQAQHVEITPIARDKYFRLLSLIVIGGRDLGDDLLTSGLAHEYAGRAKDGWCSDSSWRSTLRGFREMAQ